MRRITAARPGQSTPQVSFFLAGHNVARYVEEALRSILAQTVADMEVLFLDDGSGDETLDMAMSIADPRLVVFRNEENRGIARSLNSLMELARGEFWAHMDADDISLPERVQRQIERMQADRDICICGCAYRRFDHAEGVITLPLDSEAIRAQTPFACSLPHPFVTFRGEFFRRNRIRYAEKLSCALDYELWLRICVKYPEAHLANLEEPLGLYRCHTRQISTARHAEQILSALRSQLQVFAALGIPRDCALMKMHKVFSFSFPISGPDEMEDLFVWGRMLQEANDAAKLFEPRLFNGQILSRLIRAAEKNPRYAAVSAKHLKEWGPDS